MMLIVLKNVFFNALSSIYRLRTLRFNCFFLRAMLKNINFNNRYDRCIILGNGPSLKKDMEKINNETKVDFFGVNHFAESVYFSSLKPNKYMLLDPYFWSAAAHEQLKAKRESLFTSLNESVHWDIMLFVPISSDLEYLRSKITNNKIHIIKLNSVVLPYLPHVQRKLILNKFATGLYGPPASNVLIWAVYVAIFAGYKEVDLYGADLSFTQDIQVDQKSNQLMIKYKHFYGESTYEPLMMNPERIKNVTMEDLYWEMYQTFYAHNLLSDFAQAKGVEIKNRSSYSLIDSYPRF
ncbi:hypothetical protein [Aeromonas veronii]|uniref:hypothetical protein n=1 Tax=Aeromonas veronii TaxID=654 RepID=UPI00214D60D6|nr:hypothetical protein [Aeromonas veronii]MCR3969095.1 hypothetical protein [Aeromonas veronii]MCR3981560.1 hypothetical protein [Aeromonas veronii]